MKTKLSSINGTESKNDLDIIESVLIEKIDSYTDIQNGLKSYFELVKHVLENIRLEDTLSFEWKREMEYTIEEELAHIRRTWNEFDRLKKIALKLLSIHIASRSKLSTALFRFKLNKRGIFRKINSFFFKNLDSSADFALLSLGY